MSEQEQLKDNGPVYGQEAKEIFFKLMGAEKDGKYPAPYVNGYFTEVNKESETIFSCFDNTSGEFSVAETKHEKIAQLWITGEIDEIEPEDDEVPAFVQVYIMYRE